VNFIDPSVPYTSINQVLVCPEPFVWFQIQVKTPFHYRIIAVGSKYSIVKSKTRYNIPLPVGACFSNLLKIGKYPFRLPSHSERNMLCVKAKVAHASVFPVYANNPFPVNRLAQVHIAGMVKPAMHFDKTAIFACSHPVNHTLCPGK